MNALLTLCIGGVLAGVANAVREVVKERVIYQRERAVGLSRSAYLMSKIVVLGTVTVLQAVVLTLVALFGVDLNAPRGQGVLMSPLVEITLAVALLAFSAMMLGLLVSAVATKEEVTMPLLVLIAVVQVVSAARCSSCTGCPASNNWPGSCPPAGPWRRCRGPSPWAGSSRGRSPPTRCSGTSSAAGWST